jgi:hypothetical protein
VERQLSLSMHYCPCFWKPWHIIDEHNLHGPLGIFIHWCNEVLITYVMVPSKQTMPFSQCGANQVYPMIVIHTHPYLDLLRFRLASLGSGLV